MYRIILVVLILILPLNQLWAQNNSIECGVTLISRPNDHLHKITYLDEALAPFYHGVASGDPLEDRVIIWTRLTTENLEETIEVEWKVATDTALTNIVREGRVSTNKEIDFTVKIDVDSLTAGTTYYYGFIANDKHSLIGRTRTLPTGNIDHLRFAIGSCSDYNAGYFNAYKDIAKQHDIDAVFHLGDYIYEYGGQPRVEGREPLLPDYEIISLEDYRLRHNSYKLDPDLRAAHQQHPFICIWDDHETSNNSYKDGADNHDPATEGDWEDRKTMGQRAYFEWMPIRDQKIPEAPYRIYRKFSYGNLLDVLMLDTRLEGRQKQSTSSLVINDPERTILGQEQYNWLVNELSNSTAQWRLLGNQVVFSPINTFNFIGTEDSWDGYSPERARLLEHIDSNNIENIIIMTGDIHLGIAADVAKDPFDEDSYNNETGEGALGVELVASSITSSNLDEIGLDLDPAAITPLLLRENPHGKYLNLVDHGYFILDITTTQAQADWYWVSSKLYPSDTVYQDQSWYTLDKDNFLQVAEEARPMKSDFPLPAPLHPPTIFNHVGLNDAIIAPKNLHILNVYPNPFGATSKLSYALDKPAFVQISIFDMKGAQLGIIHKQQQLPGIYSIAMDGENLAPGTYFYHVQAGNEKRIMKVMKY